VHMTLKTLRDYVRLIFRRKVALFTPILISILLVPLLWVVVPKRYKAVAIVKRQELLLARSSPSALVADGSTRVSVRALRSEILTWNNLHSVIKKLRLDSDLVTQADWQRKYEYLAKRITIRSVAEEGKPMELIEISATSTKPKEAADLVNTIADKYCEEQQQRARRDSGLAVEFHRKGVADYRQKLQETEKKLDQYRREHFASLPEEKSRIQSELLALNVEKTSREHQLAAIENRLAEVEKQLESVTINVTSEVTTESNPRVLELETQLSDAKKRLDQLLLSCTEEHEWVRTTRKEVQRLEKEIEETPQRIEGTQKVTVNPEYVQLRMDRFAVLQAIREHQAALFELRAQIEARNEELQDVVNEELDYTDLVRQRKEYEDTLDQYNRSLTAAQGRLAAEAGKYGTQAEILQAAFEPARADGMYPLKIAFACLAAGVAVGVALMFGLEFGDASFRNVDDAAAFLEAPVLASISRIVTPEKIAREKRRNRILALVLVLLVAVIVICLAFWHYLLYGGLLA